MNWATNKLPDWACGLGCLVLVAGLTGCNLLADWRDSQVSKSGAATSSGQVQPPAQPLSIPAGVASALPVPDNSTVVMYMEGGGATTISLISPWDTLATCNWMLGRLQELGYDSGDNPSRILEGVEYSNSRAKFPRVKVQVTLNTSDQCLIDIEAYDN
jgi:hypothetical protein